MVLVTHTEINFPDLGPGDAGYIWNDPIADVNYIWDGVKWDLYSDIDSQSNYWVRNEDERYLMPRNPGDSVRTAGYQFALLENLSSAPRPNSRN